MIYCFRMGRFSVVGEHGSTGVSEGGSVLVGQEHGVSPWLTTPELEHLLAFTAVIDAGVASRSGQHEPMEGKSGGIVPRSIHAFLDR